MIERTIEEVNFPPLKILIIDEAQDCTPLQWSVIYKIANNTERIYLAGDEEVCFVPKEVTMSMKGQKFKSTSYVNLTSYAKTYYDFAYIISRMDKIISVDTATYHISDAFFIPTVVLFLNVKPKNRIKYYSMTKSMEVIDKTQSFSKFVFDNEMLSLYKIDGWESIKVSKVINLLETIG